MGIYGESIEDLLEVLNLQNYNTYLFTVQESITAAMLLLGGFRMQNYSESNLQSHV